MHISYEFVDESIFMPFFRTHRKLIFESNFTFDISRIQTDVEIHKWVENKSCMAHRKTICLFAKCNDQIVGWSFWSQTSNNAFDMINSAVFPEYRNQWIYSQMLLHILNKAQEEGFAFVTSKHLASNNPIIIAKLKSGFHISGIEISSHFWTLVKLTYFINKKHEKLFHVRTWNEKPDEEIMWLIQ